MAATLITRPGGLAARYLKPIATTVLAIFADGSTRQAADAAPTVTSGTGAPTEAANNGSVYLRTDGTTGDDSLYMRIAGAWIAIAGQTP